MEPHEVEVPAFSFSPIGSSPNRMNLPPAQALELPNSVHSTTEGLGNLVFVSIAPALLQLGPLWSHWLLS